MPRQRRDRLVAQRDCCCSNNDRIRELSFSCIASVAFSVFCQSCSQAKSHWLEAKCAMSHSLVELDAQLAALREQLGSDADSDRRVCVLTARRSLCAERRGRSGSERATRSDDDAAGAAEEEEDSLEAIPALAEHLLPEFYTQEAARRRGGPPPEPPPLRRPAAAAGEDGGAQALRKKKRRRAGEGEQAAPAVTEEEAAVRPVCLMCSLRFSSDAQLKEHMQARAARAWPARAALTAAGAGAQGKRHLQKERELRGEGHAHRPPPQPLQLQVRPCRLSDRPQRAAGDLG